MEILFVIGIVLFFALIIGILKYKGILQAELQKIWNVRNEKFTLAIVGFLLTGCFASFISNGYQEKTWIKKRQFEIFKKEIEEAQRVLEEVNKKMRLRVYTIQKLHWELECYSTKTIEAEYSNYLTIKDDWNINIAIYRNKIRRLVDEDLAFLLLDSNNAQNMPADASVQASFKALHEATRDWKRCLVKRKDTDDKTSCEHDRLKELKKEADKRLQETFTYTDRFNEMSYRIFLSKYNKILTLDEYVPNKANAADAKNRAAD